MSLKYDEQEKRYFEYCDTFRNDLCARCGRPMSRAVGSVRCRERKPTQTNAT